MNEQMVQPVVMKENDKFQLGASTRSYIVKWMPVPQESSESSSSSCSPSKSAVSNLLKGLEDEFQSALKIEDKENRENQSPEIGAKKRQAFKDVNGRSPKASNLPQYCACHRRGRRSSVSDPPRAGSTTAEPVQTPSVQLLGREIHGVGERTALINPGSKYVTIQESPLTEKFYGASLSSLSLDGSLGAEGSTQCSERRARMARMASACFLLFAQSSVLLPWRLTTSCFGIG